MFCKDCIFGILDEVPCLTCDGTGCYEDGEFDSAGNPKMIYMTCPTCDGLGKIYQCESCNGTFTIAREMPIILVTN